MGDFLAEYHEQMCIRDRVSWNRIKPLLPQEEGNETDEVKVKKTPVEALKVKHLSFTYPDGKKILDDISFSAKKGQIIGITGAVACGKSTLGKAFLCEYPYEGHITVDLSLIHISRSGLPCCRHPWSR